MKKITFILGGIRSGKTHFAYQIIDKKTRHSVTYIATGLPVDKEIKRRIKLHIASRPKHWQTIEEPLDLLKAINKIKTHVAIIDCINFWLSNLLRNKTTSENILTNVGIPLTDVTQIYRIYGYGRLPQSTHGI